MIELVVLVCVSVLAVWSWFVFRETDRFSALDHRSGNTKNLGSFGETEHLALKTMLADLTKRQHQNAISRFLREFEVDCTWNPGGSVSRIGKIGDDLTDKTLKKLCWIVDCFPNVDELSICNAKLSGGASKLLIQLDNIKCLRIIGTTLGPDMIETVEKGLPNVRVEK